ncbi:MAG: beta-mannosidase, partial [Blastocatellia bacterium]|nr:beta-mannosidase [Blastocatellia bacterium]
MLNTIVRISFLVLTFSVFCNAQSGFVKRKDGGFLVDGKPHTFIGTNYWYGSLLGLEKDKKRGIERLRRELDFLKE